MATFNEHNVRELVLYAENDGNLYRQRAQPIIQNLARKIAKGTYNATLAVKAWEHWATAAARAYGKEFGASERNGLEMFSVADRRAAAQIARDGYDEEVRAAAKKLAAGKRKNPSRDAVDWYAKHGTGKRPKIRITYETWTPEDAEIGDTDDKGWINKEGVSMVPDSFDRGEGLDAADLAIKFLRDEGAREASSSHFHKGIWYTNYEYDEDYRTGAREIRSFHLSGFSEAQERKVFDALTKRRNPSKRKTSKRRARRSKR